MQQVNFSELNEMKKKEFFNYLLSNNIQFKEGESNYYAKVVLKPTKENVIDNSFNKNANSQRKGGGTKQKSKEKERPKVKEVGINKQRQKENVKDNIKDRDRDRDREKQNKHPSLTALRFGSKERDSFPKRPPLQIPRLSTPTRSQSPFIPNRRKELSLSDYSLQMPLNLSDIITNTDKNSKCKTQRSNTNKSMTRESSRKKAPPPLPLPEREIQPPRVFVPKFGGLKEKQLKPQRPPSFSKSECPLSPYLRIFKISNSIPLARPSKYSRHQLDRAIQQIYTFSFHKNNLILKTKKFRETMEMDGVFVSFIMQHYEGKYKVRKNVQFNIVSLVNSLVSHMEGEKSRNLVIFSRFLKEEYHYEDLIFFLFVRNLAEKQVKQVGERVERKGKDDWEDFKFSLSEKEVIKLIKALVGKDEELLGEYCELLEGYFTDGAISIYQVLEILLQNYYRKRQNTSTNRSHHPPPTLSPPSRTSSSSIPQLPRTNFISRPQQPSYQIHTDSDSQQLTFGQSTVPHRQHPNDTFWYQTNQKADIPSDPLQVMIVQKMDKKISDLIKYILDDDEDFRLTVSQFHGLIFNKARNLVRAVFDMDKLGWFRLLNIREPSVEKLGHVEGLQKMVRMMRNEGDGQLPNRFCKSILTTEEFLGAIKKIVIG